MKKSRGNNSKDYLMEPLREIQKKILQKSYDNAIKKSWIGIPETNPRGIFDEIIQ